MPAFDMVVVGSGGGPDETNLSAYLFKPHDTTWEDGIVALEAGSAQGALSRLLNINPLLFSSQGDRDKKQYTVAEIYSFVQCFVITHAHLDHVNGLVLSAGSLGGSRKRIYATKQTLDDLECIFADRLWPNLASWNEDDESYKLLYSILRTDTKYRKIHAEISVRVIPVNHGRNQTGVYESAAFFVRHDPQDREFLFFGDVEPDSIASRPQTINVWRAAAPKIPQKLSTIFIECSWPSDRPDNLLYGHLNPGHLLDELVALATEVIISRRELRHSARPVRKKHKRNPVSDDDLRGALDGVRVYIIHCKDNMSGDPGIPMRDVIVPQVRALVENKGLGAQILATEQGMHIDI